MSATILPRNIRRPAGGEGNDDRDRSGGIVSGRIVLRSRSPCSGDCHHGDDRCCKPWHLVVPRIWRFLIGLDCKPAWSNRVFAIYSIISSALANKAGGMERPRDLAVFRLTMVSNFEGCWDRSPKAWRP